MTEREVGLALEDAVALRVGAVEDEETLMLEQALALIHSHSLQRTRRVADDRCDGDTVLRAGLEQCAEGRDLGRLHRVVQHHLRQRQTAGYIVFLKIRMPA